MALYPSVPRQFFVILLPLLAGFLLAVPHAVQASGPPQLEQAKGKECIQPAEWMRRNHMDFLKGRRDLSVREGVRVRSESFKNCASCHTSREKFCDRCHAYAGVAPNCFDCHHYPK